MERSCRPSRPKVLLVERNVQEAQLIWEHLELAEPASIQCTWAETIPRAFQILDSSSQDLLLLSHGFRDQQLLNGLDELRARAHSLPLIVLLGARDDFLAQETIRRGARACLVRRHMDNCDITRTVLSSIEQNRAISRLHRALEDLGERHRIQSKTLSRTRRRPARMRISERSSKLDLQGLESSNGATS